TIGGDAFLDGVRIMLSAGVAVADGERRVSDLDFSAGGARATGALTQHADGLVDGRLALDAADISTAAALFLAEASGAAQAAIALSAEDGRQNADIEADLRDIIFGETRLGRAHLEAAVRDLFNVPAIDGTLDAQALA